MNNRILSNLRTFLLGVGVAWALAAVDTLSSGQVRAEAQHRLQAPDVEFINPSAIAAPRGYTHVVDVRHGRMVFISGQVALDREGNVVGAGDIKAQAEQVFKNLQAAVEAAGGSFKDVVKLNIYLTDASEIAALREIRDRYVNVKAPPASTAVVISRLFRPEFLIEIEAVAVLPPEARMIPARR
jgi:reactive intermediate/imine deaminase